jgi:transcriptional regulator with XRE-family HTH domain
MAKRTGLQRRRLELGFTQQSIAESMGISATTYRDWERGIAMPRAGFRPGLARRLEVSLVELGALLDMEERVPAPHGVEVPGWLGAYAALEQGAAHMATFQPFTVPGLLETRTYAEAIERCGPWWASGAAVARLVQQRVARQEVLTRWPGPLRLRAVIDESVLHRIAGDGEIMFDQLTALVDASKRSNIELRVLPFNAGGFSAAFGSFTLLTSHGGVEPYMVCVLDAGGPHYLDRTPEVVRHNELFTFLTTVALSPEASVELIRTVAKETYT